MQYFLFGSLGAQTDSQRCSFCYYHVCSLNNVHSSSNLFSFLWSCVQWLTAILLLKIKFFFYHQAVFVCENSEFSRCVGCWQLFFLGLCMSASQNQIYIHPSIYIQSKIFIQRNKRSIWVVSIQHLENSPEQFLHHDQKHLGVIWKLKILVFHQKCDLHAPKN